jgi:hypothetical protein
VTRNQSYDRELEFLRRTANSRFCFFLICYFVKHTIVIKTSVVTVKKGSLDRFLVVVFAAKYVSELKYLF